MGHVDPMLVEIAENANTYTPLASGEERIEGDGFVLWLGNGSHPAWNVAQRFRLADDEVERALEEIHGHVRRKGREACSWEVGTHATPPDLVDRLLELGLVLHDDPHVIGMVVDSEPPPGPPAIVVREAETLDDFRARMRIGAVAFDMSDEWLEDSLERLDERAAAGEPLNGKGTTFLAFLDGEPVASATSTYTSAAVVLNGGATLPEARGRGAYRALVHARWQDAVAHGTPALVTQAGKMSQPILERLGFRAVCEIHVLVDVFDARS